jgi:hypothetical protein
MAIQFDTLRYVETLKAAGVPEAQAKAEAEALVTALGESASGALASKDGVVGIKLEMAESKSDLKLMRWMNAMIFAGVLSLMIKTFF